MTEEERILAIEEQRCQADLDGDSAAMERLLDDSSIYIHTGGHVDDKASLIDNRKKVKILALAGRDHKVRISGDLAVITGALYFRAQMLDSDRIVTNDVFVMRVLMRKGDEWRFILYQATARAR